MKKKNLSKIKNGNYNNLKKKIEEPKKEDVREKKKKIRPIYIKKMNKT
jgi:glutamate formiminotransferase